MLDRRTQRGRSFLFFSQASPPGTALSHDFVLKVPENGLIALNVPLDRLRLGARSAPDDIRSTWLGGTICCGRSVSREGRESILEQDQGEMVAQCAHPAFC